MIYNNSPQNKTVTESPLDNADDSNSGANTNCVDGRSKIGVVSDIKTGDTKPNKVQAQHDIIKECIDKDIPFAKKYLKDKRNYLKNKNGVEK